MKNRYQTIIKSRLTCNILVLYLLSVLVSSKEGDIATDMKRNESIYTNKSSKKCIPVSRKVYIINSTAFQIFRNKIFWKIFHKIRANRVTNKRR